MVSKKKSSKPQTSHCSQETAGNVSKESILPLFWDLASLNDTTRCEATVKLITSLKQLKVEDGAENGCKSKGDLSQKNEDDVDEEKKIVYSSDPVIQYSVQRLIKGLGSGRKLARIGFATALLEVLQDISSVDLDAIKEGIDIHLKVSKSLKGQEEKDSYFGRLFGLIILSKCLILRADSDSLSKASNIIKDMLNLGSKKVYLREFTSTAVCDLFEKVSSEDFRMHFLDSFKPILCNDWINLTPDDVFIILRLSDRYEIEIDNNLSEEHWSSKKILQKSNFGRLSKLLAESSDYTMPIMHSIWKLVMPKILSKPKNLSLFWSSVIEDTLMQSSHERKFLGFAVLQLILSKISAEQVGIVFSPNLMRSLINAFTSSDSYLHQSAKKLAAALPDEIEANSNPGVAYAIVNHLLTKSPVKLRFDEVAKSKVIEKLVSKFTTEEANIWIEKVMEVFVSGQLLNTDGSEVKDLDESACRQWALNQLLAIAKCKSIQQSEEVMMNILEFLFLHSYFNVIKNREKAPAMKMIQTEDSSVDYHKYAQMRFEAALKDLSHHQPVTENGDTDMGSGKRSSHHSAGGVLSNGDFVVYRLIMYAKKLLSIPKYLTLVNAWEPEAYEMFETVMDKISNIKKKASSSNKMEQRAFELLLLHCAIRLFKDAKESIDVIEELMECHNKITQPKTKSDASEPHWTEVVTEILLSLLTQPSNLMRYVVDIVIASIVNYMTPEAVQIVLNSLKPEKMNGDSQLQMEDSSDEEDEVDQDDFDKDNNKNDNESANKDSNDEESDDSTDDDDDDDDDDEDDSVEIDEKLRLDVKAALGDAAMDEDEDDDNDEDDEEEDIDMDAVDDSVLEAMDKALGAVFKSRAKAKSAKKNSKEMKKSIIHFKLRVLDVVDLIVKKRSADSLVLDIVEPLHQVVSASDKTADEKAFNERARGILTGHLCKIKTPKIEQSKVDSILEIITRLMDKAKTASSGAVVTLISSVLMFLIRVVRGNLPPSETICECEEVIKISSLYKAALHNFMTVKQSNLQPVMFRDLVKRFPDIAWSFADDLPTYCNTAVHNYRKMQAVELLELLFHHQPPNFKESYKTRLPVWIKSFIEFLNSNAKETTLKSKQLKGCLKVIKKTVDTAMSFKMIVQPELASALQHFVNSETSDRHPATKTQVSQTLDSLTKFEKPLIKAKNTPSKRKKQDESKTIIASGSKKTNKRKMQK